MKVNLICDGGYESFAHVAFPIEVDALKLSSGGFEVNFDTAQGFPGFLYDESDVDYGGNYYFHHTEVEVVDE